MSDRTPLGETHQPPAFIEFHRVSVTFANGIRALDDVTLSFARGSVAGLVGESGSGKSTLCRVMVGLQRVSEGKAMLDGQDLSPLIARNPLAYRRRVQMLLQEAAASLSPRMSVGRLIAEPFHIHGLSVKENWPRALATFRRLGLVDEMLEKYPHQLSGGQARRVAIARALTLRPELIVADEPTAGLDLSVRGDLLNLMRELRAEFGLTYLIVSHDLNVIRRITDRTAVMYLGQIVEEAATAEIFAQPRHPYTAALLSARPVIDPARRQRRILLSGEIPSPINPPSGCRFHTRCPLAKDPCRIEKPALTVDTRGSYRCHFPLVQNDPRMVELANATQAA